MSDDYLYTGTFIHQYIHSKKIWSLSQEELLILLSENEDDKDDPALDSGDMNEKFKSLIEILQPLKPKHREKNQEEIQEAYGIMKSMSHDEQKQFASQYPGLMDNFILSLRLDDYILDGAGLIIGLDLSVAMNEQGYENQVLRLLDNPETYEDIDLFLMILEICQQVYGYYIYTPIQEGSEPTEKALLFMDEVECLMARYTTHTLDEKQEKIDPIEKRFKSFLGNVIKVHTMAKKENPNNTGKLKSMATFWWGGGGGDRKTTLKGISLAQYQMEKEWGGSIYGIRFGKDAIVDAEIDLNNDYLTLAGNEEKTQDMAYARVEAATIPLQSTHYISANMTTHMDTSHIDNILLEMSWPTPKTTNKEVKKDSMVKALVEVKKGDAKLNQLRYLSRYIDGETGKEKEYTLGIGEIDVKGLRITGLGVLDVYKNFNNNQKVIYRLIDAFMNSVYLLTDVIMGVVGQLIAVGEAYNPKELSGLENDLIQILLADTNINIHFDSLKLENIFHSEYGLIKDIELGKSDISMTGKPESALEIAAQDETNAMRQKLADLKDQRKAAYAKQAKLIYKGKLDKKGKAKKYQEVNAIIVKLNDQIEKLETTLKERVQKENFSFELKTTENLSIGEGFLVEEMIKASFSTYLKPYGLYDMEGLAHYKLPQGLTLKSDSVSTKALKGTQVIVPELLVEQLTDASFEFNFGTLKLVGKGMNATNIKAKATLNWSDVDLFNAAEDPVMLQFETLEVYDGLFECESFELIDEKDPSRNIQIAGKTVLNHIFMKFHDLEKGFEDMSFGCETLEIKDLAAYELAKVNNPDIEAWFVEDNGRIVLNGLEFRNFAATELITNNQNEKITESRQVFSYNSGMFKYLGSSEEFQLNANLSYFYADMRTATTYDKTLKVNTSEHKHIDLKFGILSADLPYINFKSPKLKVATLSINDKSVDDNIKMYEKNIEELKAYDKQIQDGYYYEEDKQKVAEDTAKQIAEIRKKIQRSRVKQGVEGEVKINNLRADISLDLVNSNMQDQASGLQLDCVQINSLEIDRIDANNVRIQTFDKRWSTYKMYGRNFLEGFYIRDAYYDGEDLDLDPGGMIGGSANSLAHFTTGAMDLDNMTTGSWNITKISDEDGYSYNVQNIKGDYQIGYDTAVGNLDLSINGTFNHDKEAQILNVTMQSSDLLGLPQISTEAFKLKGNKNAVNIEGIYFDVDLKYRIVKEKGEEVKKLDYVKFRKLKFDWVSMAGSTITFGDKSVSVDPDREVWLENFELHNAKYDFTEEGLDAFTGKVSAQSFDLSNFSNIVSGKDGKDGFFRLLQGGVTGENLKFGRMRDGSMWAEVDNPEFLMSSIALSGIYLGKKGESGEADPGYNKLFQAGHISYAFHPKDVKGEEGAEDVIKGQYFIIKDAAFTRLPLSGSYENENLGIDMDIRDLILFGKVGGDLKVSILDDAFEIEAVGTDITLESAIINIDDVGFLTKKTPEEIAKEAKEQKAYDALSDEEKKKHDIAEYNRKRSAAYWSHYNQVLEKVLEEFDMTRADYDQMDKEVWDVKMVTPAFDINGVAIALDEETQAKEDRLIAIRATTLDRMNHNTSADFNFLDHMISGKIMMNVFGEDVMIDLTRVKEDKTKSNSVFISDFPADEQAEKNSGGGYATYGNMKKFIKDLSFALGRHFSGWTLGDAVTDDELKVAFTEDEIALTADAYSTVYLITLMDEVTTGKTYIQDQENYFLRLSSMIDTIVYNQGDRSLMIDNEQHGWLASLWNGFIDFLFGGIASAGTRAALDHARQLMHTGFNPRLLIVDAEFDLEGKENYEKGLLNFITPKEQDANLKLSMNIGMNQGHRSSTTNFFGTTYNYRNLGPELEITNFNMPSFKWGDKTDRSALWLDSAGATAQRLFVGKNQYDMGDYRGYSTDWSTKNSDPGGRLEIENLNIKGFKLRIPRAEKK